VALADIRAAGLRLQRGGVGFYPTSGSPFVHLDTGSIRHWPRMTPDQLAKVFPDGRTVHQSTSGPMKGFELAKADIDRRGDGEDTQVAGKPGNFLAALFKGKSATSDEDDEGAAPAPAKIEKPVKTTAVAATAPAKPAEKPAEKSTKAAASTLQLASADAKIVPAPKPAAAPAAEKSEPSPQTAAAPQTPADIINARGFWDNIPAPQQATPAQVAALNARGALGAADPQPTASVSDNFNKAMAYAPAAASPVDRSNLVAASAPIPRNVRAATPPKNSMAVNDVTTVVAKGAQGQDVFATSARLAASKGNNELWLRVMMLAPSASTSMSVTVFGDADLTLMRQHFVKPQAIVAMTFSDDPTLGLVTDRFSGSSTVRLETMSFVMRTAALR
jgi:uncharacterized protein DUF882